MRQIIGGLAIAFAITGCGASDGSDAGANDGDDVVTCAELAEEAVGISEDQAVRLLKVREPKVELDKQDTDWKKPTGTEDLVILRCQGTGVWSDGSDAGVRLELSVDSDGDAFVFYKPTL